MKITIAAVCAPVCALVFGSLPAFAVDTKTWTQADLAGFDKGTLTGLSISSEGKMTLAPAVKEIFDPSTAFLSAVARDSKGNIYTGGGGLGATKSKLFVVDPKGTVKTLAELDGIAIQAIAIDAMDRVYAATWTDGRVYRVSASGQASVFYDPKAKYIWAMAFDKAGNLYVATGDQGEIHKVTPAGVGSVFFKTEETHARSLAVDGSGNLIVGTDPSGLILRVSLTGQSAGQGFVLYQAPKREITAVAVAPDGTVYAAGDGTKQAAAPPGQAPATPPSASAVTATTPANAIAAARPAAGLPQPANPPTPAVAGGSEIYQIQTDGYARKVWSDATDLVYSLAFDSRGKVIAGTGNRGNLYRIDSDHSFTRLRSMTSMQVTGLVSAPDGTIYAVTGNIGKLFTVGPGLEASGTYESDVMDAGEFSYWGRVTSEPGGSGVTFETRSGNLDRPQQNWSPWEKLNGGRIASPTARFLEYRATLTGSGELAEVETAYQMKNVAPTVQEVEITRENYRFPAPAAAPVSSSSLNNPVSLSLPPIGHRSSSTGTTASPSSANTPSLTWAKGFIGARWLAADDNGDSLIYTAEIRGVSETTWKPLRDKIQENYVSWDSTAYSDGKYVLRITASDSPSNPPDQAMSSSRESDPFVIDNTPPAITGLAGTAAPGTTAGGKLEVRFHAKDALSTLGKAEYSINGGDWTVVEPTTGLTDSTELDYRVIVERSAGETTVAVRVTDEFENQAVAKTVVR
jgi:sugar lactone lactonase YvrE